MYDDYDLDYTCDNDHSYDLDEYYEAYTQSNIALDVSNYDEDYARDGQDYQLLAYRHYA